MSDAPQAAPDAHVIVLGNEKGGSGKSTTAMHILTALMADGYRVGALDLDLRQASLTRYLQNRRETSQTAGLLLPMPDSGAVTASTTANRDEAARSDEAAFDSVLTELQAGRDIVVIDCPGSDTHLSRLAHARADTLITPVNDSFVDVDLLARVDRDSYAVERPSLYSEMVWQARQRRAMADGGHIDWIVMRNRVSVHRARNKAHVEKVLAALAKRIGFRFLPGLSERVIFRELFLKGLTLTDLPMVKGRAGIGGLTMSHVAARQELRMLVQGLSLPRPARAAMQRAG